MVRFALAAALFFAVPFALLGCTSPTTGTEHLDNEDLPEAFERARELENLANAQIAKGNGRKHPHKRREHFNHALHLLREARDLFEQEALENKGTPERQKTIEREMDRLSDQIEQLHKIRPT